MRARAASLVFVAAVHSGCEPAADYPPPALASIGLHNAPSYIVKALLPSLPQGLLLAHPRLGHAAVRIAGEPLALRYLTRSPSAPVTAWLLDGGTRIDLSPDSPACVDDGVCSAEVPLPPAIAAGLYDLCIAQVGPAATMPACSTAAVAVVEHYVDPIRIAHVSDIHAGDGQSAARFGVAVDVINAMQPPPDLVAITGDCADTGRPEERRAFVAELVRLRVPSLVITGNHDFDAGGIDGFLVEIEPELDVSVDLGALRVAGTSTQQDLDDGQHLGTLSESGGPDASQLAWLDAVLVDPRPDFAAAVLLHHPLWGGLFGTVGPSRDQVLAAVSRPSVRAVLAGHLHYLAAFDGDGLSGGLALAGDTLARQRWPLHFGAGRVSNSTGGFALHTVGKDVVAWQWIVLP